MNEDIYEIDELTEKEARYHIEKMVKYLTKETDKEVISGYSDTFELIVNLRIIGAMNNPE